MKKPTNNTIGNLKVAKNNLIRHLSAHQKTIFLILAGLMTTAIIVSFTIILTSKDDPEPIITPLSKQRAQKTVKPSAQETTYYVNITQRFLTQAEELSKNTNQTAEDKETILIAIQNALETINEGISHYPKDDRLYAQRAKIYQGVASFAPGALEAAVADLDQARKLSPQNPAYPKNQSQILAQIGRYQDASLYAKIAYEIEPHNLQNLADLGQIQISAGQISGAIESYQTLASLLPQDGQKITSVRQEIASLEKLLAQVKNNKNSQLYLAGEPTPSLKDIPADINILPQEQASLPQNLVIASPQEEDNQLQSQSFDLNAIAGEAIIPAGDNQITIYSSNLNAQKKINLAPREDINNQILYIKNKVNNPNDGSPYFVVALSKPIDDRDLTFKWWIIEE